MERKLGKLQPYCLEWSPDAQVARKFFELWWIVHVHWWVYDYFPQFRDKMMSNSYHEWTMCLLMCILIACVFLSESIAFVQRVQTWKRRYVMCKRLFDCIATRARLMIFERLQGRNWTTIVYIYIYMYRPIAIQPHKHDGTKASWHATSMLWHQPTSQKGVTLGGMQLEVLWWLIVYHMYTELDQIRSLYSISWSTWSYL